MFSNKNTRGRSASHLLPAPWPAEASLRPSAGPQSAAAGWAGLRGRSCPPTWPQVKLRLEIHENWDKYIGDRWCIHRNIGANIDIEYVNRWKGMFRCSYITEQLIPIKGPLEASCQPFILYPPGSSSGSGGPLLRMSNRAFLPSLHYINSSRFGTLFGSLDDEKLQHSSHFTLPLSCPCTKSCLKIRWQSLFHNLPFRVVPVRFFFRRGPKKWFQQRWFCPVLQF